MVYHVINRANNRREIFQSDSDYRAWLSPLSLTRLKALGTMPE